MPLPLFVGLAGIGIVWAYLHNKAVAKGTGLPPQPLPPGVQPVPPALQGNNPLGLQPVGFPSPPTSGLGIGDIGPLFGPRKLYPGPFVTGAAYYLLLVDPSQALSAADVGTLLTTGQWSVLIVLSLSDAVGPGVWAASAIWQGDPLAVDPPPANAFVDLNQLQVRQVVGPNAQ